MVNFGNVLQGYLAATQQMLSGDQLNNTKMAITTYTLPTLPYAYDALEPYISREIMTLHHEKHHQAYVTNLNAALQAHVAAVTAGDIASQIALQASIKFNGGGHINHSLFWLNLSPSDAPETKPDAAPSLQTEIEKTWGTLDAFKKAFSATLLALQGSGWGWLVKEGASLRIITTKDQDPVVGGEIPVLGVDMWEHAYYLQYLNGKAAYVENIWNVINWKTAEERFLGTGESILEAPNGSI
ncbi:manganese superoxide dismutase precursor [Schizothecium vesticola]|uniref:Superoxide dismutase n=1 Tax=Schizothecium vesticola TaxID=314040 RepID=A0AA40FBQ3_9PEZI|nr:manganese superoxide dismutase precursor [Schizothecium vesticola]